MKLRLANPEYIVDLNGVDGMEYIRAEGPGLRIGALTRHRALAQSAPLRERYTVLAEAAGALGDPEVRNRGTIGGALAHADPASDWGTALLALDTTLVVQGPKGTRNVPIDQFFKGPFTTVLRPSEILREIRVGKSLPRSGSAFRKLKRKVGDFATVSVGASVWLRPDRKVARARISLGAVGPHPRRAKDAEEALVDLPANLSACEKAAALAAADAEPTDDLRGDVSYKRAMVDVYACRALDAAIQQARR